MTSLQRKKATICLHKRPLVMRLNDLQLTYVWLIQPK